MKHLVLLITTLLYTGLLYAAPRTTKQALEIARSFISTNVAMKHAGTCQLIVANNEEAATRTSDNSPAYFVINAENNNGFVIVSGDDCAREVLAYSNTGNLSLDNLPPNAKYWLGFYAEEIKQARLNGDAYTGNQLVSNESDNIYSSDNNTSTRTSSTRATTAIAPLLGNIEWDQGNPYNILCPTEKGELTVTGCSATALAMVMKYYAYPQHGIGSHSYTSRTLQKTLSVNFAAATYNWDLMLPRYTNAATEEQQKAVAELMLHCGVGMDMNYNVASAGGSGAGIFKQHTAAINFFGYNPNAYFEGRDYNTEGRWKNLIQEELNAGRPVLYSGQSTEGGHAFVLDGCDENDMYHFNWGWSGYANGYYSLSSLSPGAGGTGSGSGAYNDMQYILLMLQPEEAGGIISGFTTDAGVETTSTQYGRNEKITLSFSKIYNTASTMNGLLGLALYQGEEFVTFLSDPSAYRDIPIGSGWNTISFSGVIPSNVANGSYQLHFASQKDGEKVPSKLRGLKNYTIHYNVEVKSNTIVLEKPDSDFDLYQLAKAELIGEAVVGEKLTFKLKIENKGMDYDDEFGVYILKNGSMLPYDRISNYAVIPAKSTTTITISGNTQLPVGEYYAIGSYRKNNAWRQFANKDLRLVFEIKDVGTSINSTESAQPLKVVTTNSGLNITSEDSTELIYVYSPQGSVISTIEGGKGIVVLTHSGIYFVKQGKTALKVLYNLN